MVFWSSPLAFSLANRRIRKHDFRICCARTDVWNRSFDRNQTKPCEDNSWCPHRPLSLPPHHARLWFARGEHQWVPGQEAGIAISRDRRRGECYQSRYRLKSTQLTLRQFLVSLQHTFRTEKSRSITESTVMRILPRGRPLCSDGYCRPCLRL